MDERKTRIPESLPAGLIAHCESCGIVIPSDAPRPTAGADCAFVAQHRLAWFDPGETVKGQHTAATAAWKLIYHEAVEGPALDAACVAYWQQYGKDPKKHFTSSLARTSLLPAQVAEQEVRLKAHRDKHFYQ